MNKIQSFVTYYKDIFIGAIIFSLLQWSWQIASYWFWPSGYAVGFGALFLLNVLFLLVFLIYAVFKFFVGDRYQLADQSKIYGIYLACFVLIGFVYGQFALEWANQVRLVRFEQFAEHNMNMVEIIYQYQADHDGTPPEHLNELVPEYLDEKWWIGDEYLGMKIEFSAYEKLGDAWSLRLSSPVPFLDYAQFIYLSSQDYPQDVSRMGDWGYLGIH